MEGCSTGSCGFGVLVRGGDLGVGGGGSILRHLTGSLIHNHRHTHPHTRFIRLPNTNNNLNLLNTYYMLIYMFRLFYTFYSFNLLQGPPEKVLLCIS